MKPTTNIQAGALHEGIKRKRALFTKVTRGAFSTWSLQAGLIGWLAEQHHLLLFFFAKSQTKTAADGPLYCRLFILPSAVVPEVSVQATWSKHVQNLSKPSWSNWNLRLLGGTSFFLTLSASSLSFRLARVLTRDRMTHCGVLQISDAFWNLAVPTSASCCIALGASSVHAGFLCCLLVLPLTWHQVLRQSGHYFVTLPSTRWCKCYICMGLLLCRVWCVIYWGIIALQFSAQYDCQFLTTLQSGLDRDTQKNIP